MPQAIQVRQKPKHPGGRPMFDGRPEYVIVTKLEDAFIHGCNQKEAALKAGITEQSLLRYIEKHPEFRNRIDLLRSNPNLKSKYNLVNKIEDGDVDVSIFWLKNQKGSDFNNSDNDKSSTLSAQQDMDSRGIADIIAICVGRSIAEYETARQERARKVC